MVSHEGTRWTGRGAVVSDARRAQAQDKQVISLEFQDAPVTVILQALADYRQMNLIAAPGVSGNLTLRLENVPRLRRWR